MAVKTAPSRKCAGDVSRREISGSRSAFDRGPLAGSRLGNVDPCRAQAEGNCPAERRRDASSMILQPACGRLARCCHAHQVLSVAAVPQSLPEIDQLIAIDPGGIEDDFFGTDSRDRRADKPCSACHDKFLLHGLRTARCRDFEAKMEERAASPSRISHGDAICSHDAWM